MADDADLESIRQRRMAELMAQRARQGGGAGGAGGSALADTDDNGRGQAEAEAARKAEADDRRQMMLMQLLTPDARERLHRIALVKADKARGVEDILIRAAQQGQITEKVTEDRLISMLEQISERSQAKTKVTIQRRRGFDDD
eukprot:jgi/Chlat1/5695/Chrsp38S09022